MGWSEGVVVGEEEGFLMEVVEIGLAGGAAGVEGWGDEPVAFGSGGDEESIHGPVVVFAEGEAVGGVVVVAGGKGNEMGGADETGIADGEIDAHAAGGALVVVDFEDFASEGGAAAVFQRAFGGTGG